MFTDFLRGVSYLPRGLGLLWAPGLRRFVWLPVLVNAAVFAVLFWLGAEYFQALMNWLLPAAGDVSGNGWLGGVLRFLLDLVRWLLWPIFLLAAVIVMFYAFTAVANLIGSPFNGMLSARVEKRATGRLPPEVPEGAGIVVEAAGAVVDELRKMAYFALLGIPLLILFVIPVANVAAPFLWAIYGAWIIALEYMDYPLGNHGLAFRDQRRLLRRRRMLHLGFGAAVLAITIIPVLNLVAMPAAVIGATLLRLEQDAQELR